MGASLEDRVLRIEVFLGLEKWDCPRLQNLILISLFLDRLYAVCFGLFWQRNFNQICKLLKFGWNYLASANMVRKLLPFVFSSWDIHFLVCHWHALLKYGCWKNQEMHVFEFAFSPWCSHRTSREWLLRLFLLFTVGVACPPPTVEGNLVRTVKMVHLALFISQLYFDTWRTWRHTIPVGHKL